MKPNKLVPAKPIPRDGGSPCWESIPVGMYDYDHPLHPINRSDSGVCNETPHKPLPEGK